MTDVRNKKEDEAIREYHLRNATLAQYLLLRFPMYTNEFIQVEQEHDQIETHGINEYCRKNPVFCFRNCTANVWNPRGFQLGACREVVRQRCFQEQM